jgi:hypothetical protein
MSTSPTPPSSNQPPTWPVAPPTHHQHAPGHDPSLQWGTSPTPPQPKPKRRGPILLAVTIGVALLVVTGCAANSGPTDPGPDPTSPTTPSPAPTNPPDDDPAPRSDPPKEDPEPAPGPKDPAAVVRDYFAAINARDYREAWRLGGQHFSPSYEDFVRGFADTEHDTVTVLNVDGPIVTIRLVADESGGRQSIYQGTYTADHGELVAAQVRRVPGPPPTTQPPGPDGCDPSYPDVCLDPAVGDYDCAGGTGNGPGYVEGPIRVRPPDPFDLDGNGDGVGCENG